MLSEPYGSILFGAILVLITTIIGSIITLIIKNYTSEKQWLKKRVIQERATALEQVYSPLYFYFSDISGLSKSIAGLFSKAVKNANTARFEPKKSMSKLRTFRKELNTLVLRNLLQTKIGLIKPPTFRDDLFGFLFFIEYLEEKLNSVTETEFKTDDSIIIKKFENYSLLANGYFFITKYMYNFLKNEVFGKDTEISKLTYTQIINIKMSRKLRDLLRDPKDVNAKEEMYTAMRELLVKTKDFFSDIS